MRGCKGKYEEVLEEGIGPRVPRSKDSKVQGSQNSNSNTSLTLKKVNLVYVTKTWKNGHGNCQEFMLEYYIK